MTAGQLLLRAAWALPLDAPPIPDAALLIADGRIAAIGPANAVAAPEGIEKLDLSDAALLPGLVNAHTHLELTGIEERAGDDFPSWILNIRRLKQARSTTQFLTAAKAGLRDCWAGGITTIADTGDSGAVIQALAEMGGAGVTYQEVFGPNPAQLEDSFGGLSRRVDELRRFAGDRIRLGVSPHAPYTVSGPLYSRVAEWADREGLPLAVHVAESRAETQFVTSRSGPFAEAWKLRGIPLLDDPLHLPPPASQLTPVSWLHALGVLGPATLCIHAIQLTESDLRLLQKSGAAVAHCPVSNARHRHGTAPLDALRSMGVRVGLGTDSVASVGTLDLFAEMRAARDLARLRDEDTLTLATIEGARALGLEREIGTLTPGKWGDVIAVRIWDSNPSPRSEPPLHRIVAGSPSEVLLTVLGGRIVHSLLPPHDRRP